MTVATVITGGATMVILKSEEVFSEQVHHLTIEQTGRRVMERLAAELRQASPDTVLPALLGDTSWIYFKKVTGFTDGAVQLGAPIIIFWQLAAGESANGLDDNGDGYSDEGLLLYSEGWQKPVPLAAHVFGLRFNSTTGGVAYEVDVGRWDRRGALTRRTFAQEVSFRN
jgi:hypothetical protein